MGKAGKTFTIFLVVIAVLLLSVTAIAVFLFLQEVDLRKTAEYNLEQLQILEAKLQADLKEANKRGTLLEQQKKEAEDRIEDLTSELELEKGLKEEQQNANRKLDEDFQKAKASWEEERQKFGADLTAAEEKLAGLQKELQDVNTKLTAVEQEKTGLQAVYDSLKEKVKEAGIMLEEPAADVPMGEGAPDPAAEGESAPPGPSSSSAAPAAVSLEPIVVTPREGREGRVISVDRDTDFLIVSLGEKDGVDKGTLLAIFRGEQYLGDVNVSRVLPEMSAADFVPPLTNNQVQRDDRVIVKQ